MTDRPSGTKILYYYLSFVLLFATLAFIASMLLMNYEDRTGILKWVPQNMGTSDKIGYIGFCILQFPFGLIFGLLTGNYNNGLFAFLINPLFIGWTLQKIFQQESARHASKTIKTNYIILATVIAFVFAYLLIE